MQIIKNWLSRLTSIFNKKIDKQGLAKREVTLDEVKTDSGSAQDFKGIIVAEILEVKKHPNADRLQIATVYDGKNKFEIVCGAPNIAAGQKVPLATVGTYLPAMKMTIEQRAVRGVTSQGMLCASDELGLGSDHSGILILKPEAKVGSSLFEALRG